MWGNVGVADKGEGHPLNKGNKLFPLTKYAIRENCDLRENRCPPSEKTKRYEMQKFSVVRLQIEVQNRADSGHRQTA